jgi:hypothetical protein
MTFSAAARTELGLSRRGGDPTKKWGVKLVVPVVLLCFVAVCAGLLGIGMRLLVVARRTRGAPEMWWGLAYLLGGLGALSRGVFSGILGAREEHHLWLVLGSVLGALAVASVANGIRSIFRSEARWAVALQALVVLIAAAGVAHKTTEPSADMELGLGQRLMDAAMLLVYAWGGIESYAYHLRMRRRLAIGLADPVLTDQFRLWSFTFLCMVATIVVSLIVTLGMGMRIVHVPALFVAIQLTLVAGVAGTWIAFFPPRFYRSRVESRSEPTA